jgi:hypothetical protein
VPVAKVRRVENLRAGDVTAAGVLMYPAHGDARQPGDVGGGEQSRATHSRCTLA